jgi:excisionase family DNA binding protein
MAESDSPTSRTRRRGHRYRDVAKILNCSERHVIREVQAGKLKVVYIGQRSPRIFDDALDAYVAGQGGSHA